MQIPNYYTKELEVTPPVIVSFKEPISGSLATLLSYPITIQTTVKDQSGTPLEGVHLYSITNTTKGATSDKNGFVRLENVEADEIVTFSFVGNTKHIKAMSVTATTVIQVGTDLPEVTLSAKKPSNAIWWLLGIAAAGLGYKAYKDKQKKKVVSVNL
jgi:hypothetical protein